MGKKRFWKLQYSVTIFVVIGVLLMIAPVSIESSRQAYFISKWKEAYSRMEYVIQVIRAHISDDMIKNYNMAKTSEEKEQIVLMLLKPYLRLEPAKLPRQYHVSYMNKNRVTSGDDWFFKEYYYSDTGMIVGIKDLNRQSKDEPVFIMMFDVNGMLPPNTWGMDVYGIVVYDTRVTAIGSEKPMDKLPQDCSKQGRGLYCSYYYLIGGEFED